MTEIKKNYVAELLNILCRMLAQLYKQNKAAV
jgi:hypothetical protein